MQGEPGLPGEVGPPGADGSVVIERLGGSFTFRGSSGDEWLSLPGGEWVQEAGSINVFYGAASFEGPPAACSRGGIFIFQGVVVRPILDGRALDAVFVHPWDSVPVTIPFHDGEYLFEGGTDTHHTLSFEYTGYDCSDVATINVSVDVVRIG